MLLYLQDGSANAITAMAENDGVDPIGSFWASNVVTFTSSGATRDA